MNNTFEFIWENKLRFLGIFFIVFTITYIFLVAIDFLPEPVEEDQTDFVDPVTQMAITAGSDEVDEMVLDSSELVPTESETVPEPSVEVVTEAESVEETVVFEPVAREAVGASDFQQGIVMPTAISIPKLGKNITVLNPKSRTIADLDAALLNGVVRHPDSATLDQEGNVFILGHSSYLPNVFNENYQAFNGIQDLAWGDKIEVSADGVMYEYRVERVYKADAQDTTVPIAGAGYKLTLATCNSFGSVDDRFIVEAKRVGVKAS